MKEAKLFISFGDIGYKLDFLLSFLELTETKRQRILASFPPDDIYVIQDFEILYKTRKLDIEQHHHEIVHAAFMLLHQINTGTLQKYICSLFRSDEIIPEIDFSKEENISQLFAKNHQLKKYYDKIKYTYTDIHFTNDALFDPAFCFFWGLADLIDNNRDFLQQEVVELAKRNNGVNDTKLLSIEIIEKILLGRYLSPEELMILKFDEKGFKLLVSLRKKVSLDLCLV